MAYPPPAENSPDCIPNTNEYTESGSVLNALVVANPDAYVTETHKYCTCCLYVESQCCDNTLPLCLNCNLGDIGVDVLLSYGANPPDPEQWYGEFTYGGIDYYLLLGCGVFSPVFGLIGANITGSDICTLTIPHPAPTAVCDPFSVVFEDAVFGDMGSDCYLVIGTITITATECPWWCIDFTDIVGVTRHRCVSSFIEPDTTLSGPYDNSADCADGCSDLIEFWWCVDKATYPFRECVQGVTEARNGPYSTKASCEGDVNCLPCNYYCTKIQEYDEDGNPVGQPTFECRQYSDVVPGQVIIVGSIHYTIEDGPYTFELCKCPPCDDYIRSGDFLPCDLPVTGMNAYACLDGVCVSVVPGTEASYGPIYFNDPTCEGTCV